MSDGIFSAETKEYAKEQEAIAAKLMRRKHSEGNSRGNGRDEAMRDYARVLYSSSFRRLQGKMQLLGVSETNFNRNRLTHSLEVAQISRTIALELGLESPVFAETCSLLHDIGNPPFGHYGENILNGLAANVGGYEGNAQTLRIIRKLEKKSARYAGLNLTIRTLWGVTKYFNTKCENPKKYLYFEDYAFLREELDALGIKVGKSIDAQIMDLADEIAYAAHDLEDALSVGLMGIGELLHEFKISSKYSSVHDVLADIVKRCQKEASDSTLLGTSEEYSAVFKKELVSEIVNALCRDIGVVSNDGEIELGYQTLELLAVGLKVLVFKVILRKTHIQQYEKRGGKIINGLFQVYTDEAFNRDLVLLPAELRSLLKEDGKERLVTDYISGMMDAFSAQEYKKYFGESAYERLY